MAKAALEMALLDAELHAEKRSFGDLLGVHRDRIPSGVSVGIHPTIDDLLAAVAGYVDDGYVRIKLKIEPGWDLEPVAEVRRLIGPDVPLQVDANAAYTRQDVEHLARLDEFDLLLIEQPLPEDDLLGHAELARAIATPVCLDESIISATVAADAIEFGAAEIINIKPGRVGGYLTARRIHDLCRDRGIPAWCGGMLETGIGRAANAALAALDGFTLPGDVSASQRFWARDIVTEPIEVVDGHVAVPTGARLRVRARPRRARRGHGDHHRRGRGLTTALHSTPMPHPFLSAEWMAEAKAIRERYAGQTGKFTQALRINQVVTGVPFGEGTVETHLDTSSGDLVMELGRLDEADATVTTDYETAKAIFVDQDPAAPMQAFMAGKITVQGDMMKVMALQTAVPTNDVSQQIAAEIKAMTA